MTEMCLKGRASDIRRVGIGRLDAQVFGQHHRRCPAPATSRKQHAHLAKTEARIHERVPGRLSLELEHRFIWSMAEIRLGHTHNRNAGMSH